MFTTIQKWGNSQAVRLPKGVLEAASLNENDQVELVAEPDCIIIRRARKKHLTLAERIAGYQGGYQCQEWDIGKPEGNEV